MCFVVCQIIIPPFQQKQSLLLKSLNLFEALFVLVPSNVRPNLTTGSNSGFPTSRLPFQLNYFSSCSIQFIHRHNALATPHQQTLSFYITSLTRGQSILRGAIISRRELPRNPEDRGGLKRKSESENGCLALFHSTCSAPVQPASRALFTCNCRSRAPLSVLRHICSLSSCMLLFFGLAALSIEIQETQVCATDFSDESVIARCCVSYCSDDWLAREEGRICRLRSIDAGYYLDVFMSVDRFNQYY